MNLIDITPETSTLVIAPDNPLPLPIIPGMTFAIGCADQSARRAKLEKINSMTIACAKVRGIHPQDEKGWRGIRAEAKCVLALTGGW